jgi:hypothetical protein
MKNLWNLEQQNSVVHNDKHAEGNLTATLLTHFMNMINGAMNIVTENHFNLERSH